MFDIQDRRSMFTLTELHEYHKDIEERVTLHPLYHFVHLDSNIMTPRNPYTCVVGNKFCSKSASNNPNSKS